jgi:hypothetical protein
MRHHRFDLEIALPGSCEKLLQIMIMVSEQVNVRGFLVVRDPIVETR